jgi:hypothetical protein
MLADTCLSHTLCYRWCQSVVFRIPCSYRHARRTTEEVPRRRERDFDCCWVSTALAFGTSSAGRIGPCSSQSPPIAKAVPSSVYCNLIMPSQKASDSQSLDVQATFRSRGFLSSMVLLGLYSSLFLKPLELLHFFFLLLGRLPRHDVNTCARDFHAQLAPTRVLVGRLLAAVISLYQ